MTDGRRFYEAEACGARRSAPAAMRNREPIADVLVEWLPSSGVVLEIASGTGEHSVYFAGRFPSLDWQPSDVHGDALSSIVAWSSVAGLPNLRSPLLLDAASDWAQNRADETESVTVPSDRFREQTSTGEARVYDAVLCINMVHISPWCAALGLLNGSSKVLRRGGALILYGPWLKADVPTAPSNLEFDSQLKERDSQWGLRCVEDFEAEAEKRDFVLEQVRAMPANNLMLLFRLR